MEPTYTVDDSGDTLLTLCDPNRPFEAVEEDDLWNNHLTQYDDVNVYKSRLLEQKREHHLREASINHPPPKNPGKEVSWRVSLKKLRSASMTFQVLAAETRKENKLFQQGYKYTIRVEGWNARALHKLILRIHGEDAGLYELQSEPKLCAQLAVIVDEYQCHNLFQLRFPVVIGRYPYNENLLFRLFSSWVFRDEGSFKESSKAIIMQTRGRMHTLGMPIPESIIIAIEQKRKHYITEMVNFAHGKVQKLLDYDPQLTPNQEAGDDLKESLNVTFRGWPPKEPFYGYGVLNVYRALKEIIDVHNLKFDDYDDETDSSSETDTSMTDHDPCIVTLENVREAWRGLDINNFPIKI